MTKVRRDRDPSQARALDGLQQQAAALARQVVPCDAMLIVVSHAVLAQEGCRAATGHANMHE